MSPPWLLCCLLGICLLLLHVVEVRGYSEGAGGGACSAFDPAGHHENKPAAPRPFPSPFAIKVEPKSYTAPGGVVQVTLEGQCSRTFKGFLIQARRADPSLNNDEMIGTFTPVSGTQLRCGDATAGGLTHTDGTAKSKLTFNWNPPATSKGHIVFKVTFMETFQDYWIAVKSDVVKDSSLPAPTFDTTPSPILTNCPKDGDKFTKNAECGKTKGCFSDCDSSGCNYEVTWQQDGATHIMFTIKANFPGTEDKWMALGFSSDQKMGSDAVSECVFFGGSMKAYNSYNEGKSNKRISNPTANIKDIAGIFTNGVFECTFSQEKSEAADGKLFDLNKDWYILFARGDAEKGGIKRQHTKQPLISSAVADFQSTSVLSGSSLSNELVKSHGCLMVVAWMFLASVGLIIARYYKPVLTDNVCSTKMWFLLHRSVMVCVVICCAIGFILIFVHVEGYSESRDETSKDAHPVLGIFVMALALINPTLALFRCHPGTQYRPIFNWVHFTIGVSAHIIGVVNVFLGLRMGTPDLPEYVIYIVAAYVAWHLCVELLLEIIQCMIKKKDRSESYEMQPKGVNAGVDSDVESAIELRRIILLIHIFVSCALSFAVVGFIAKA